MLKGPLWKVLGAGLGTWHVLQGSLCPLFLFVLVFFFLGFTIFQTNPYFSALPNSTAQQSEGVLSCHAVGPWLLSDHVDYGDNEHAVQSIAAFLVAWKSRPTFRRL